MKGLLQVLADSAAARGADVQTDALEEYDMFSHISQRRYVPPNFAEIRHILNISQVHASSEYLQLITFDADGTLYEVRPPVEHLDMLLDSIHGDGW